MNDLDRWIPADAEQGDPAVADVWAGVAWGRLGQGDRAWEVWESIEEPSLRSWIAAEKGRILRELGLHDDAEELEAPALEDCDDVVVRAMLAIGLAADAVGRNDVASARSRLAVARGLVASAGSMPSAVRQQLRLAWVSVEVAQVSGEEPPVDGLPARSEDGEIDWPEPYAAGTDFHRAKGLLFAAVVRDDVRLLDAALPLAPPILEWAVHLARHDVFAIDALDEARRVWQALRPPPGFEAAVAATSVGQRLAT